MLRDLLVRACAGLLCGAIAISCSHAQDQASERVGSIEQAASVGGDAGAGGAATVPGAGGVADTAGAAAGGAAGGQPASCDPSVCEAALSCTHCVGNACVRYQANDGHVCRGAVGAPGPTCDLAEVCDGSSDTCPADAKKADQVECNPAAAGGCDLPDTCDGKSDACVDKTRAKGFECNPIKVGSLCDVAEVCDGSANPCPTDVFQTGTTCRPVAAGAEGCDVAEICLGNSADCPEDAKVATGTSCLGTSSNKCATIATCQAGACVVAATKTCPGLATDCVNGETCNPLNGVCSATNKANGITCQDGFDCTVGDTCLNGTCKAGALTDARCTQYNRICAAVSCEPSLQTVATGGCKVDPAAVAGSLCRPVLANATCDIAEKCDGVSADCPTDLHKPMGTECLPASCSNNQAQAQIKCDGGALCPTVAPLTCSGYACDGSACRTECATSADCNPDHYCLDKVCEVRVGAGKPCDNDAQCSGSNPFCADGVCCDTKCDKQCEACDVTDKAGTCSPVTGDPHGQRTACKGDGSVCSGTCGGALRNSCTFKNPQTECLQAACDPATGMALEQAFCDGAGRCAATDPMECAPFTCGATACRGNCVSDQQCAAGSFCKAGICEELQKQGDKCARDAQCASGFCADGVCCDGRCDGQCESCGGGKCSAVTGAPVGKRPACAGADGDDCAGACDGKVRTSCVYPGGEIACRDAACDAGVATVAAHCTGAGACAASQTVMCPNGCEGTICAGDTCLVSGDCKEGEHCIAGTCAPQGADGAVCGAASDCASGFCVDGVCCNRACDGQCEACDGKKPGVCGAVSGAPHGARVPCTADGSACGGACDGKEPSGCSYPNGTVCAPGSCSPGRDGNEAVATVEATCNGSGRCPAARDQACGGVGCDARAQLCNGDCADGSACPGGQYCSAGICVTSVPTGVACQANAECASSFCVDGYCCGSACDDRCAACDVPGLLGKCSPVLGATHGGRPGCPGGGVCGAQCDGKNVTDCAFPDDSTSCSAPYCSNGTAVAASACDGAGQCRAGEATACASFACDGGECTDVCTSDADCTRDLQCHESKCVEAFKINAVDQGTCGCKVPGGAPSRHGAWLSLLAVSVLAWRRRRGAQASEGLR